MGSQAIRGVIANQENVEKIISALIEAGIDPNEISIRSSQEASSPRQTEEHSKEPARNWRNENRLADYPSTILGTKPMQHSEKSIEKLTKAPEGATAGATTGCILGGSLGLLAGLGALAIPGIESLVAIGPLMGTLSGVGAGGTIGGILGAIIGAEIPEKGVSLYEHRLKKGPLLLSAKAHNDQQIQLIMNILKQQGASEISVSSEAPLVASRK